jgi:hypothetical protein
LVNVTLYLQYNNNKNNNKEINQLDYPAVPLAFMLVLVGLGLLTTGDWGLR